MALIKLTDTEVSNLDGNSLKQGYLYKDLFLDLDTSVYYNKQFNKSTILKDAQGLYDENAVLNSITNIFLTAPGEKILSPEFGLDLRRYLFEPISDFSAFSIKDVNTLSRKRTKSGINAGTFDHSSKYSRFTLDKQHTAVLSSLVASVISEQRLL